MGYRRNDNSQYCSILILLYHVLLMYTSYLSNEIIALVSEQDTQGMQHGIIS